MKILMLNTFVEEGGAAKAAVRIHRGVRGLGVDSRFLVHLKNSEAPDVICAASSWRKLARRLKLFMGLLPVRMYPNKPENNFSPALLPDKAPAEVAEVNPDIIHLHWLGAGFLQIETLGKFNKPLIWTLHDSWAFTGGCHVPFDCTKYRQKCGACPVLGSSRERDLSRWTWNRKERAWRNLNLTVATPSRWLADCARSSSLFRDTRIEVIPNGLDLMLFKPVEKSYARGLLGLPPEKKLILFGAVGSTSDRNKGFHLLLPALQKLSAEGWNKSAELIVFGASEPSPMPSFGMEARYLGRLKDDINLALLYAAADVFVAPSMLENLPNTVMEAMACGTPCVAFNQGGMPELIEHGVNGYLAQPYDPKDLAAAIGRILEDDAVRQEMSRCSRRKVAEEFGLDLAARRYADLYRGVLGNSEGERHG